MVEKLVQAVINAYAHDPEGLTRRECRELTETPEQAQELCLALGRGAEGEITAAERANLESAGFAAEFIKGIADTDGKGALRERAKWLSDNMLTKWWRWDLEYTTRIEFAKELGLIGAVTPEVVPALIKATRNELPGLQVEAVKALGRIGPVTSQVVPALMAAFEDKWPSAARALGAMGSEAEDAVPMFVRALEDEGRTKCLIREVAAEALGRIGHSAEGVVPALIRATKDRECKNVQMAAAGALGMFGEAAEAAIPRLSIMAVNYKLNHDYVLDSLHAIFEPALRRDIDNCCRRRIVKDYAGTDKVAEHTDANDYWPGATTTVVAEAVKNRI